MTLECASKFDPRTLRLLAELNNPLVVVNTGDGIALEKVTEDGSSPFDVAVRLRAGRHLAWVPALRPEGLGDPTFRRIHNLRYAYVAGAMAGGISSARMVISMAKARMLCFFGAGGLALDSVEAALREIRRALSEGESFGANLVASPLYALKEMETVQLYQALNLKRVGISGFVEINLPLVLLRVTGLRLGPEGQIRDSTRVFAKVSHPTVARRFLEPPPAALLSELLRSGLITQEEASLARSIPLASELTVEGDSGGHTDNGQLSSLFSVISKMSREISREYQYQIPIPVGVAGGIGTPQAVASAFATGAAYVLTGSINQSACEAGTSQIVKELLCQIGVHEVDMAPAADMFELGTKVQVSTHRTLFAQRARKLWAIYQDCSRLTEPSEEARQEVERILQRPVEDVWLDVKTHLQSADRAMLAEAEQDPKKRMAAVFKWYLHTSARWAIEGFTPRMSDFQIWCSQAAGAFNQWVKGTYLEMSSRRHVVEIADNLMRCAAILLRVHFLTAQGITMPQDAYDIATMPKPAEG